MVVCENSEKMDVKLLRVTEEELDLVAESARAGEWYFTDTKRKRNSYADGG